VVMKG